MSLLDPHEELDRLHARNAAVFASLLGRQQAALLEGDDQEAERLAAELGELVGRTLATADLLGRRRLLLELRSAGLQIADDARGAQFATPRVPFVEALEDILARWPVLAPGWEATRDAWLARGFALARSMSDTVSARVQQHVARFLREGEDPSATVRAMVRSLRVDNPEITRSYAELAFRTQVSSAYHEGRRQQAQRPGVRRAASGWRYVATLDEGTRENHRAGDGFVAHVDDPVWAIRTPPLGYQCRCALEIVPTSVMVRLGLSTDDGSLVRMREPPPGFEPDPGFKGAGL